MKHLFLISTLFLGMISNGQGLNVIEIDSLSEAELKDIDRIVNKDGWVHIRFGGKSSIWNFSNKEYMLNVFLKCTDDTRMPGYLIEFSKYYRDGSYAHIDFSSSGKNKFARINFYVDNTDYGNPFLKFKRKEYSIFYQALKSGKLLRIDFFDKAHNPQKGDDELSLNRSISFKLGNSDFLEIPVDCKVFTQSNTPSEEVHPAN